MTSHGTLSAAPSILDAASGWDGDTFVARHAPDLRLVLIGHGMEVTALARLGQAYGTPVTVFSPNAAIVMKAAESGQESFLLGTPARRSLLVIDRRTAVVFLFHDHDWEIELLAQTLEQDAFYVGAMGSRRTHAQRVAALLDLGLPLAQIARVIGPIGQIPATRDPDTLALSILAQIVDLAGSA